MNSNVVSLLNHQGAEIIYVQWGNCIDHEDMVKNAEDLIFLIKSKSDNSVLLLADFTGALIGTDFMNIAKKYQKDLLDKKVKKQCITGINTLQRILFKAVSKISKTKIEHFKTIEECKKYLIT